MATEIERKFLIADASGLPELGAGVRMRQGYVARDGAVAVRVRITPDAAWLTVKAGAGVSRTEVEVEVDAGEAESLWPYTQGRRIDKTRSRVTLDGDAGLVAEIDRYEGDLVGLCTVEVEFPSEASAAAFVAPPWFGPDVTEDVRWTNASLAEHGLPS